MLPLSKVSKTFRTSSNTLSNTLRGKDAKRVESMNEETLTAVDTDSNTSTPTSSPLRVSSKETKKPRFLPSFFESSGKSKETMESKKSLSEITTEIEDTLDSLDATYSFSRKRDKIKAKITKGLYDIFQFFINNNIFLNKPDSKTVRFTVAIGKAPGSTESSPLHLITFSRRSGDKDIYSQVCDNVKRLLDI